MARASSLALLMIVLVVVGVACGSEDEISSGGDEVMADVVEGSDSVAPDAGTEVEVADEGDTTPEADSVTPPVFEPVLAETLQKLMDEHVGFAPEPGLTLTVRTADGAMWTGASGIADLATGAPMEPDSAFQVGSNTKPVVAATIMLLVEEGLVDLEAPLTDYLPEYAEWDDITVRLLLNMRSGLKDYLGILSLMLELVAAPDTPVTPEYIIEKVRAEPLDFEPDTAGAYTNSGYLLLGMIIEAVTGQPADEVIKERILEPLGMEHTYLDVGGVNNELLAKGYIDFEIAGPALGLSAGTTSFLPDPQYYDGLLLGNGLIHPTVNWTAGSLVSTSEDMATLIHALMDGDFLEPDSVAAMKETVVATLFDGPVLYGLGLQVRETPEHGMVYGHGGLNFGYQAATYFYPDSGITLSHLHNFLIDDYTSFQTELMDTIIAGGDPGFEPCLDPGDVFEEFDTGAYLNVAFKGQVNVKGTADDDLILGNTTMRLATEDGPVPFSGILPVAAVGPALSGDADDVTISAYTLSPDPDIDLIVTSLTLSESLFAGLDEDGRKTITLANLGDLFLTVLHGTLQEGTTDVYDKLCIVAISDYRRNGEAAFCGAGDTLPASGDMLKLFATIPYLDDPDMVAGDLAMAGIDPCSCLQDDGTYGTCPEEE